MTATYTTWSCGSAGGLALARYARDEPLTPTLGSAVSYYLGESAPVAEPTEAERLGRLVHDGDLSFGGAVDLLMQTELRNAAADLDYDALQDRLMTAVADAAEQADFAEAMPEQGKARAEMRRGVSAEMLQTLGIKPTRHLTEQELGHLYSGRRADGEKIKGRTERSGIRSLADVFGLPGSGEEAHPVVGEALTNILGGRRADGEAPRTESGKPLAEDTVRGALKRFLAIYEAPKRRALNEDELANMHKGLRANGRLLDSHDWRRDINGTRDRITAFDITFSPDKSLSVAWATAQTAREKAIFLGMHQEAIRLTMPYVESIVAKTRRGDAGRGGFEDGEIFYTTFQHYQSRPAIDLKRVKDGEEFTERLNIPENLRKPDAQLHSHTLIANLVRTPSGHVGSIDGDLLKGQIKTIGAVYHAHIAKLARSYGVDVVRDKETGAARFTEIPEETRAAFSSRTEEAEAAARDFAAREGADWNALTGEQQSAMVKTAAAKGRAAKDKNTIESSEAEWRERAIASGYRPRTLLHPDAIKPELSREQRLELAYTNALPMLDELLQKSATVQAEKVREIAARSLIDAGIGNDAGADINDVMRMFRQRGVTQHGERTDVTLIREQDVKGKERWVLTTELHEAEEGRLVGLASLAAADRRGALTPAQIDRAADAYLAAHPRIDRDGAQWQAQRAMMTDLSASRLAVGIGTAGAGKSSIIAPLTAAWREDGRQVLGVALAWRTAGDFAQADIARQDQHSAASFISRVEKGKLAIDSSTVVVVDEVAMLSTRQLLQIAEITTARGASLVMVGDPEQTQAVEAGNVIRLLEQALPDRIPAILTSIRQRAERDRDTADLWRQGRGAEALERKAEDGNLHIVAGGSRATVAKAAELWQERIEAHRADDGYSLVAMTETNASARTLSMAIREKRREAGDIGPDLVTVRATDGHETYDMPIARGDIVRLFTRVFDADTPGRDQPVLAANGETVTIEAVTAVGMKVRNDLTGAEGTIAWRKLQEGRDSAIKLAHGVAMTINVQQGVTATDSMVVFIDGTAKADGDRALVADSRHKEVSIMVVDESSVRQSIAASRPKGRFELITRSDVVRRIGDDLSRKQEKTTAIGAIDRAIEVRRSRVPTLRQADYSMQRQPRQRATEVVLRAYHRRRLEVSQGVQRAARLARELPQYVAKVVQQRQHDRRREQGRGLGR